MPGRGDRGRMQRQRNAMENEEEIKKIRRKTAGRCGYWVREGGYRRMGTGYTGYTRCLSLVGGNAASLGKLPHLSPLCGALLLLSALANGSKVAAFLLYCCCSYCCCCCGSYCCCCCCCCHWALQVKNASVEWLLLKYLSSALHAS